MQNYDLDDFVLGPQSDENAEELFEEFLEQMTDLALSSNWTRTLASQAGNVGSSPASVTTAEHPKPRPNKCGSVLM